MLQERYSDHDDTASITKQQATRNNFALESTLVKDYDICIVSIYYLKYSILHNFSTLRTVLINLLVFEREIYVKSLIPTDLWQVSFSELHHIQFHFLEF